MDIVEYKHPMLVVEIFQLMPSSNKGMVLPHAMGYMMDTGKEAYVTFPKREIPLDNWVVELKEMTKDTPNVTKQLLRKGLGEPAASKVMAIHNI